ncbi:MAG TPA: peroxiredoxin-like family protein [Pirellulales bacterium]|nr:peroxiredoxin-like family protein [Pirellulales bacterium]
MAIGSYGDDAEAAAKIKEGFALPARWDPAMTTLGQALEESRRFWQDPEHGAMPRDYVEAFKRALAELVQAGLEKHSLQVGQTLPTFSLANQVGQAVRSEDFLASGPLVLSFYRGGWSPFCILALRGLQHVLPQIKKLGGSLVAITPELPDNSLSTVEKLGLSFDVLTDHGLGYARQLGIVWKIPEYALKWQEKYFGVYLEGYNGAGYRDELPVPATFIINRDGTVTWRFLEAAYWQRAEPSDVVEAVRGAG